MTRLKAAWEVTVAELRRTLRDPHVVAYLVAPVALYPLLLWGLLNLQVYETSRLHADPVRVRVEGADSVRVPLESALRERRFEVLRDSPESPHDAPVDIALVARDDGVAWQLEAHHASTRPRSRRAMNQLRRALGEIRVERAKSLVQARGVGFPPAYVVHPNPLNGADRFAQSLIGVVVGYIGVFAILLSGVYPAIDLVVAERERSTLETLLVAAVPRWVLLLGKTAACGVITWLAALGNMGSLTLVLLHLQATLPGVMPRGPLIGGDPVGFSLVLPVLAATALLVASLNITVALLARTFKEGEMMGTALLIAGVLPGFVVVVAVMAGETSGLELIPIGNAMLAVQLAAVGDLGLGTAVLIASENLALALVALVVAGGLMAREDFVLLGRQPRLLGWMRRPESP